MPEQEGRERRIVAAATARPADNKDPFVTATLAQHETLTEELPEVAKLALDMRLGHLVIANG